MVVRDVRAAQRVPGTGHARGLSPSVPDFPARGRPKQQGPGQETARARRARPSPASSLGLAVGLPGPRPRRANPRCSLPSRGRGGADHGPPAAGRGARWRTRARGWLRPGEGAGAAARRRPRLPRGRDGGRERRRCASRPRVPGAGRPGAGPGVAQASLLLPGGASWAGSREVGVTKAPVGPFRWGD